MLEEVVAFSAGFEFDAKAGFVATASFRGISPVGDGGVEFFTPLVDERVGFCVVHTGVSVLDKGDSAIGFGSW